MKKVVWIGASLDDLRRFPPSAKSEAGRLLRVTQEGGEPMGTKAMPNIGAGVREIRIHLQNEYRVIFVAKFKEAVYVLHCFVKKTMRTAQRDIDLAKARYQQAMRIRGEP